LDTIKNIDYDITPNIAIKKNLIGSNIIWVGKIDTIEINTIKKKLQLIFYCTHFYFDTISKELICSKKMKLKKLGDGNCIFRPYCPPHSFDTAPPWRGGFSEDKI
jgi:hypothetical protein